MAYELTGPLPSLSIPSTLQDSLMARLDRLKTGKTMAQLSATLGRKFSYALLQAVAPLDEFELRRTLAQLVQAELLYQQGTPPQATYFFKHALLQEAAYHSLLKNTRRQYHRKIAEVLVEQFTETVEAQPELVAYHYTEGDSTEQAVTYWQRAGQQAARGLANQEAIIHLEKGLKLLDTLPQTRERSQCELDMQMILGPALANTRGATAIEVKHVYTRARELCGQMGKTMYLFPVLYGLWRFYNLRGSLQMARELGADLLTLAQQQQDPGLLLGAHQSLGTTLFYLGEFGLAGDHLEQGIANQNLQKSHYHDFLYEQDLAAFVLSFAAWNLWYLGYPDQALQRSHEATVLAQEMELTGSQAMVSYFTTRLRQLRRDAAVTKELAEETLTLSTKHGFAQWAVLATLMHGWAHFQQGQREEGMLEMRQGVAGLRAIRFELVLPSLLLVLIEACGKMEQVNEGLDLLSETWTGVGEGGGYYVEAEMYRLKGELLLAQAITNASQAETCFQQALTVSRQQQAKSLELRAAMSLSRLWQSQDKRGDAYALLAPVYNWFTEGFDTADLKDAKTLLDALEG